VIAYQMLTGKLDAAPGTGATRTLKRMGVADDVADLLLRCASEELEDRPKDAGELKLELSGLVSGEAAELWVEVTKFVETSAKVKAPQPTAIAEVAPAMSSKQIEPVLPIKTPAEPITTPVAPRAIAIKLLGKRLGITQLGTQVQ